MEQEPECRPRVAWAIDLLASWPLLAMGVAIMAKGVQKVTARPAGS